MAAPDRKTQLLQAAAQVKASKHEVVMVFEIGGYKLLFPYDDGLAVMKAFEKAERLIEGWKSPPEVRPIADREVTFTQMPLKEVKLAKMAHLLGLPLEDLREELKREEIPF